MSKMQWYLTFLTLCILWWPGSVFAEVMYVTDRLYLSLRNAPDPEEPAATLLPSDTKVEVLTTEGDWAQVELEDGKTGWVLKRFLTADLPRSMVIEQLKAQIEQKNTFIDKLQGEMASRVGQISNRAALEAKQAELLRQIETLKNQVNRQTKRIEVSTKEETVKRLKEVYVTGIIALFLGLFAGYMMRRPKKKRQLFY